MKQGVFMRAPAADASETVIDIVGVIGWEVGFQQLRDILRAIPEGTKRVVFDIYSPGGDVWEGNGMVQAIGELGQKVETVAKVQVAASMATLIAAACKTRTMSRNGRWLIHNAWTQTTGDAAAHEKAAQTLRDAEMEAAKFYAERTGQTADAMLKLMAEERWILPEEAKELGFVQEICDPFEPEEYEEVRQEIVAAGKWPKALAELPSKEEVKPDARQPEQPEPSKLAADVAPAPVQPVDDAEYKRGYADGEACGRKDAAVELVEKAEQLSSRLAVVEKEARLYQSEKDRLSADLVKAKKQADERQEALRAEVKDLAERLQRYVAGSIKFEAPIETIEDVMGRCGGNLNKAAEMVRALGRPDLLQAYRAHVARKE